MIEFINNIKESGIDYGVIVVGYEPGKVEHEIYKMGDIIIAVNDSQCLNYDIYKGFKISAGDRITVLRKNSEGKLRPVKVTVVNNQSKVLLMNMTERE